MIFMLIILNLLEKRFSLFSDLPLSGLKKKTTTKNNCILVSFLKETYERSKREKDWSSLIKKLDVQS